MADELVKRVTNDRNRLLRFIVERSNNFTPYHIDLSTVEWSRVPIEDVMDWVRTHTTINLVPYLSGPVPPAPVATAAPTTQTSSTNSKNISSAGDVRDDVLSKLAQLEPNTAQSTSAVSNNAAASTKSASSNADEKAPYTDLTGSAEDLTELAYAVLVCKSRFLHLFLEDQLDAFHMVVRPGCEITARGHARIMKDSLLNQKDISFTSVEVNVRKAWAELSAISARKTALPAYFEVASKNPIDYLRTTFGKFAPSDGAENKTDDQLMFLCYARLLCACCCGSLEDMSNVTHEISVKEVLGLMCPSEMFHTAAYLLALSYALNDNLDVAPIMLQYLETHSEQHKKAREQRDENTAFVFHRIRTQVSHLLADHRAHFAMDPAMLGTFLHIFSLVCSSAQSTELRLQKLIDKSMYHVFDRALKSDPVPTTATLLLKAVRVELDTEKTAFEPEFSLYLMDDPEYGRRSLLRLAAKHILEHAAKPSTVAVADADNDDRNEDELDPLNVLDVSFMFQLQQKYLSDGEDVFHIGQYDDMIVKAMNAQQMRLVEICQHAISFDTFDVKDQGPKQPTSSMVDVLTALNQNALPPLPAKYTALWQRICVAIIQLYCSSVHAQHSREDAEEMLPRPPPILKFKYRKTTPPQELPSGFFSCPPVDSVLLRINNLQCALDHIESQMHLQDKHVREVLLEAQRSMCEYVGLQVAFGDLRSVLVDGLYVNNTIAPVLQRLDPFLGKICDMAHDDVIDDIIFGLMRGVLRAVEFVLLHGGIQRVFEPHTFVPTLMKDISLLEQFFHAGGDGLPMPRIQAQTKLLKEIASDYVARDSQELVNKYYAARTQDEQDNCVLVLAHRPTEDQVAFQFIRGFVNRNKKK